ncbi:MAG: hypothetical protein MJ133_09875 [Lachnospiraceae bacterium]|nr:hypothetical protein [Lachnospiraceae bacterium]
MKNVIKDPNRKQLIKTILLLCVIVIIAVVLVRTLSGSETLLEYAEKQKAAGQLVSPSPIP